MALKKRSPNSKAEQLYMLEVFIDRMNLNLDRITNVNTENINIYVKVIDLPPYEISASKNEKHILEKNGEQYSINVKSGKSALLTKTSSCLLKALRSMPLHIKVYSQNSAQTPKMSLICSSKVPTPTCLCDQISSNRRNIDGPPISCTVKNTYDLNDTEGKVSGNISILLKLSCFGSSIVKHFALHEKPFVLPNLPFGEKILYTSIDPEKSEDKENSNIKNTSAKPTLKRPASPPRISMNDPGFKNLTTAEKLNDPNYRKLIYRAYPNEPTCVCLPKNKATHPLMCRSGCNRPCCMKLRDPKILSKVKKKGDTNNGESVPTYCVSPISPKILSTKHEEDCCGITRLRGGGDVEQIYLGPSGYAWADYEPDYASYDDKFNMETRLEGGGGGEHKTSRCSCAGGTVPVTFRGPASRQEESGLGAQDACKPHPRPADKAGCVCPGKELSSWKTGNSKCTKNPCLGVDCLIRAFREAQDFVDSLGRVPGLAGLGLMDPSESPYFGRDIDKDYVSQEPQLDRKKGHSPAPQSTMPNPQCSAPCNTQPGKPIVGVDSMLMSYAAPTPLTIAVPGRTGIVREAVPTLPDTGSVITSARYKKKEEKKEEKIEKQKDLDANPSAPLDTEGGPCGEPKCKSRRKKPVENTTPSETAETPQKKSAMYAKPASISTPKTSSKVSDRGRHQKQHQRHPKGRTVAPGPDGDRNAIGKSPIKVSRRVMRYIYSIGDAYPGVNYGHKNCIDPRIRVPANMGWLWNTRATAGKLKPRIGWKPGAIGRYLNELLKQAKAGSQQEPSRPRSVPSRSRKARVYKSMSYSSVKKMQAMEGEEESEAPPTLHIHRKDGTYYVTMYPIKQETAENAEPHLEEPMKPLQFKIVKNKDDGSVASSSTASDMEIEFSPPAAVNRYRRKPDVIHVDTQVRQQEILDAFKPADSLKKKDKKMKKEKKGKK